jgi:hypothetical protein
MNTDAPKRLDLASFVYKSQHGRGFTSPGRTVYPDEQLFLFFVVEPGDNMFADFGPGTWVALGGMRITSGLVVSCAPNDMLGEQLHGCRNKLTPDKFKFALTLLPLLGLSFATRVFAVVLVACLFIEKGLALFKTLPLEPS